MITNFQTLCTVTILHSYYIGDCKDFDFMIPPDTATLLQNGKLLAKVRDGRLYILFEADATGAALAMIAGKKLRIGLKLLNPYFNNFSNLNFAFSVSTPFYENATAANALDAAKELSLVGPRFSHALLDPARPVTVRLKDAQGQALQTNTVSSTNNRDQVSYDLTGQAPGAYAIEETYPGDTKTASYYCDGAMQQLGIFGIIEIKIDSSFYVNAPAFAITFEAKKETLKYYVAARHYSEADFEQLAVADAGFTTDKRPEVKFTKVASSAFTAEEISPALLNGDDVRVVLFKSQTAVPRQEKARSKIQLSRNTDVLIKHLPQIGAEKIDGNFIIHLLKP
jgi:hypothetical protein